MPIDNSKAEDLFERLRICIALEESVNESHLNYVMSKSTNSETITKLQRLLKDTDSHAERLRKFIGERERKKN